MNLQSYAHTIESAQYLWNNSMQATLDDNSAFQVLERLLDRYHFKEDTAENLDEPLRNGFEMVSSAINDDLVDVSNGVLVKVFSVIHFVARRRAGGGRDYFEVIHRYVGMRLGPGTRILGI